MNIRPIIPLFSVDLNISTIGQMFFVILDYLKRDRFKTILKEQAELDGGAPLIAEPFLCNSTNR